MARAPITANTLFYGDNLPILRDHIADESIDLIYLDPPFNSNRSYNVLFREENGTGSDAQIEAFGDTWHWGEQAEATFNELRTQGPEHVATMIDALHTSIGTNQMMAYLVMMGVRLIELHRVLKPTGSIYLHCDPTASHYLKVVLDTIFGAQNFRSEIIWQRTPAKGLTSRQLPSNHDVIHAYQKGEAATWNPDAMFQPYDLSNLDAKTSEKYTQRDPDGRLYQLSDLTNPNPDRPNLTYEFLGITKVWRWTKDRMQAAYDAGLVVQPRPGAVPRLKRYLDEQRGKPLGDVWTDIPPINSQAQERLGYPTQKPLPLLERIIRLSSNPGDVVLDPFCGCGTAVVAAHKLGRRWIGIDITHLAIALQKYRMQAMFPGVSFDVHGEPEDLDSAKKLAHDDKYQFQWWALSLIKARPVGSAEGAREGKKGSDKGIDGVINFIDDPKGKLSRIIVQVKGGGVKSGDIRDLHGTVDREGAAIGVFITLEDPTRDMETEAVTAGYYHSDLWQKDYPKIQVLTVEQLLAGAEVKMPAQHGTFKRAPKADRTDAKQGGLGI